MCTQGYPHNYSRELYKRHGEIVHCYLMETVLPALQGQSGQGAPLFLTALKRQWENHKIMNKWLQSVYGYLDRYHVKELRLPTLKQVRFCSFQSHIYNNLQSEATAALVQLINNKRDGRPVDPSLIKSIVNLCEEMSTGAMDCYRSDLEEPFFISMREFYARKHKDWINSGSMSNYLVLVDNALAAEHTLAEECLSSYASDRLQNVVEKELLIPVKTALLELIDDDITNMMGKDIVNHRRTRWGNGEKNMRDDPEFVKSIIALHVKYSNMVKVDFSGRSLFQKALRNAFVEIVNRFTSAELLSTCCDRILRSDGGMLNDSEVEENLDQIVQLFSFLTDKDLFAEIYHNQLAKRLLSHRSISDDMEKLVIAKLKVQCGTQFTSKMERMLADQGSGQQLRQEFEQHMQQQVDIKLDFGVHVITMGFWPTYKCPEVTLPEEMSKCMRIFDEWHGRKHASRKLQWVASQGKATVRGTFGPTSYDLQVSTLQAIALDTLSGGETLSFEALAQRLNLEESILKPLMHSLSCGKHKVISKMPASNKINRTDTFTANANFSSNLRTIRIPMATLDNASFISANKKVAHDRTVAIEAAIVRIRKAHKTLPHEQLFSEVRNRLSFFFQPSPQSIQRRIEALIDREYLERSTCCCADNEGVYNYLA